MILREAFPLAHQKMMEKYQYPVNPSFLWSIKTFMKMEIKLPLWLSKIKAEQAILVSQVESFGQEMLTMNTYSAQIG